VDDVKQMSKADDFGVPDVDIVAATEEAGEIGAGGEPAAPCRPDVCLAERMADPKMMLQLFG
jgi:hypothetical protein